MDCCEPSWAAGFCDLAVQDPYARRELISHRDSENAVGFAPTSTPGTCEMSLTLSYTLQDPVEWWLLAIINSAVVQGIVRNRMRAGMVRFGKTVSAEYAAGAQRELDDAHGRVISSGSPSASTTSAESTL